MLSKIILLLRNLQKKEKKDRIEKQREKLKEIFQQIKNK